MVNSQIQSKQQHKIEKKYSRLIDKALVKYNDKTMDELLDYLELLREEMRIELNRIGVY